MGKRGKKQSVQKVTQPKRTGTAAGWSFYSTALRCWREWYLKYVQGLTPRIRPDYFRLGSAYHLFHEGMTHDEIAAQYPELHDVLDEAEKHFKRRTSPLAPPMPKAVAHEQPHEAYNGEYTCRLDRVEETGAREFKTAFAHRDSDKLKWDVDGEVIGELIASGMPRVTVDQISKKDGTVKQFPVMLTETKESAFKNTIVDLIDQIQRRMKLYERDELKGYFLGTYFPRNNLSCVSSQYGKPCQFYELCWSADPNVARLKFETKENSSWRRRLLK